MTRAAIFLISLCCSLPVYAQEEIYDDLLSTYVSEDGHVNYRGFIAEKERFQVYLDYLSINPIGKEATEEEKLAYWINTYNAFTIKLIIDNYQLKA